MSLPCLSAENLCLSMGRNLLLSGASLNIYPGELVALLGPNGVGKTTLLRALAGLKEPEKGEIYLNQAPLHTLSYQARASQLSFLSDLPDATFAFESREIVAMGRYTYAEAASVTQRHTQAALESLELVHLAAHPYPDLSSGQQQLVALARVVCQAAPCWLLDEPTSRLDLHHIQSVSRLLKAHTQQGGACVVVLHDLDFAMRLASRVVVLHQQGIYADGPPAEVLTPSLIQDVWGVSAQRVDSVVMRPGVVLQDG